MLIKILLQRDGFVDIEKNSVENAPQGKPLLHNIENKSLFRSFNHYFIVLHTSNL